jgi:hypothetical protein
MFLLLRLREYSLLFLDKMDGLGNEVWLLMRIDSRL